MASTLEILDSMIIGGLWDPDSMGTGAYALSTHSFFNEGVWWGFYVKQYAEGLVVRGLKGDYTSFPPTVVYGNTINPYSRFIDTTNSYAPAISNLQYNLGTLYSQWYKSGQPLYAPQIGTIGLYETLEDRGWTRPLLPGSSVQPYAAYSFSTHSIECVIPGGSQITEFSRTYEGYSVHSINWDRSGDLHVMSTHSKIYTFHYIAQINPFHKPKIFSGMTNAILSTIIFGTYLCMSACNSVPTARRPKVQ